MFIRKSTHKQIIDDMEYNHGKVERRLIRKVYVLELENESLRERLKELSSSTIEKIEVTPIEINPAEKVVRPSRSDKINNNFKTRSSTDDTTNLIVSSFIASSTHTSPYCYNHDDYSSSCDISSSCRSDY